METILWQQFVKVVAGNSPRDLRVTATNLAGATIAQLPQTRIDFALAPAGTHDLLEFRRACFSHPCPQAIVGEDFQFFYIVNGLAAHDGVNSAGVVADHASHGAVLVRCRIGSEG